MFSFDPAASIPRGFPHMYRFSLDQRILQSFLSYGDVLRVYIAQNGWRMREQSHWRGWNFGVSGFYETSRFPVMTEEPRNHELDEIHTYPRINFLMNLYIPIIFQIPFAAWMITFYVCMYVYNCIYIYIYIYIYITYMLHLHSLSIFIFTYVYIYIYIDVTCLYIYTYVYVYILYTYAYISMEICLYIYIYIYLYIYICIYTYTCISIYHILWPWLVHRK